jgi:SHS family lactate transporter-like MFS transporter
MPAAPSIWSQLRSMTPPQWRVFLAAYLGWTLDAFDFFLLVMVVRHVAGDFHAEIKDVTYGIFLTLATRPVGALIFGLAADRYGRRPALMASILFYAGMELATAFAPTLGWFLALRALFGIGMGGEWGVGASLAMESAPPQTRGVLSGILQEGYPVGYLLAALAYKLIFPHFGWRGMFVAGFSPAFVVLFILAGVKESPIWLAQDAKRKESAGPGSPGLGAALRANWKLFLYMVVLMTAFNFFSHGSQDLYPSAFLEKERHIPNASVGTIVIIYNLGALLGGILFGIFSQYIGRRRAIVIASLLVLPVIPIWLGATSVAALALGAFLMQFAVQGSWGVVPAHLNELSPAAVRGTFPGLAYQLGNLCASLNAPLQARLAEHHHGHYSFALGWVVGLGAFALTLLAWAGPEARDASLAARDEKCRG